MTYNGYASQAQFHAAMRAGWKVDQARQVIAQLAHGWCDHENRKCREVK